ncbi:hypothetical protein H9L05_08865 [Hymenobacter qilianensis]|uniref:Uncharacterized protein n=2 Tax=Hymenobacter qilianensis TaxID=1385715 RepID=A0A7H0GZC4_9BACT|nr:hypothetical protein [Hymenobacter qilianensis]QNP53640.1 hypothetical protein H9L05_08865 [Hymenobacter qilianensis]
MTEKEKNQLIKGLFLTTGIVLGVMLSQVEDGTDGILFAVLSAGLFFAAFLVADNTGKSKLLLYSAAIIVWLIMYRFLQLP